MVLYPVVQSSSFAGLPEHITPALRRCRALLPVYTCLGVHTLQLYIGTAQYTKGRTPIIVSDYLLQRT